VQAPRFLIARFSSIGDIILSSPIIHSIREHYGKKARIDFVCLSKYKSAAELLHGLDKIHLVESATIEITPDLKKLNFHYFIDLHCNVRSRSLSKALGIITFKVDKQTVTRFALTLGLRKEPTPHFVDRSLKLLDVFHIREPKKSVWGIIQTSHVEVPKSYISITPGATYQGKAIPEFILSKVCEKLTDLGVIIALVGGPDALEIATSLASTSPLITSFCGTTTLKETAHILKHSKLAIGGDTGVMHIACALGIPLISVWGCTRPSLGLAPWRPNKNSHILLPTGRGDRPCSRHGARCRFSIKGEDLCINHVSADRIIEATQSLLYN
jgi:ADP-heptose:LPS heptosyltransferase